MCSDLKVGEEKWNIFLFYLMKGASIGATSSEGNSELANQASLSQSAQLLYPLKFIPFLLLTSSFFTSLSINLQPTCVSYF